MVPSLKNAQIENLTRDQLLKKITAKHVKQYEGMDDKKPLKSKLKAELVRIYKNQISKNMPKVATSVSKANLKKLDLNVQRKILRDHYTKLRNEHLLALGLYMKRKHKECGVPFYNCKKPQVKEAYDSIPFFIHETSSERNKNVTTFINVLTDYDKRYSYSLDERYINNVYIILSSIKNNMKRISL